MGEVVVSSPVDVFGTTISVPKQNGFQSLLQNRCERSSTLGLGPTSLALKPPVWPLKPPTAHFHYLGI